MEEEQGSSRLVGEERGSSRLVEAQAWRMGVVEEVEPGWSWPGVGEA